MWTMSDFTHEFILACIAVSMASLAAALAFMLIDERRRRLSLMEERKQLNHLIGELSKERWKLHCRVIYLEGRLEFLVTRTMAFATANLLRKQFTLFKN